MTIDAEIERKCECAKCCDGEHIGCCIECAGWGDRCTDELDGPCDYCAGTGVCPKCNGQVIAPPNPTGRREALARGIEKGVCDDG